MSIGSLEAEVDCAVAADADRWIGIADRRTGDGVRRPGDAIIFGDDYAGAAATFIIGQVNRPIRRDLEMAMQWTALVKSAEDINRNCRAEGQSAVNAQSTVRRAIAATHETVLCAVVNRIRINRSGWRGRVEWTD